MNCTYHPFNPITVICVAPHRCQRKLCADCQFDHNVDLKQLFPIKKFQSLLEQKLQDSKILDKQQQVSSRLSLKSLLIEIEKTQMNLWANINESIQKIYDMIEEEAEKYLNLINSDISPSEQSYTQLDQLVNILQGNSLNDWNSLKGSYLTQLGQINNWLREENQKFIHLINQKVQGIFWNEKWQYYDGLKQCQGKLRKTQFAIQQTKNRELHYHHNGEILKIIKHNDLLMRPQIITNLEEIQHFNWVGELKNDLKKVGLWVSTWKGEKLMDCGGQYGITQHLQIINNYTPKKGKKQVIGRSQLKIFMSIDMAKVYEVGGYVNDTRQGIWKYVYEQKEIGGGEYKQGNKSGEWIELSERFYSDQQVTYQGEYKNDKKVGRWDFYFNQNGDKKLIGGGLYDEAGNGVKFGKWIELSDGFHDQSQVTYIGEYQNDKKVGNWDILFNQYKIGGGSYDEAGNGVKFGRWIELSDGFHDQSQVAYIGDYQNDKKVGNWDILFNQQKIGGGSYDQEGNGIKLGRWIEQSESFRELSEITYQGDYKYDKKVGRWDILYQKQKIGGGSYDQEGNEIKLGGWIEQGESFRYLQEITYHGDYKNGKKFGTWVEKDLRKKQRLSEIQYDN